MIKPIFLGENSIKNSNKADSQIKKEASASATQPKKDSILDKFYSSVKNSSDMNDTIKVPRTIFKGYLAFFASTTLLTLGSFAKKHKKIYNSLNISSAILALYGTYAFVRPYLLRQKPEKTEQFNKN